MKRLGATVAAVLARVLECLPALGFSWLVLRAAELVRGHDTGTSFGVLALSAVINDALALARHGFVLMLLALPLLVIPSDRWRVRALGLCWTLLLCVQAVLVQYHWVAGVPLGADLFGYTPDEIRTTVAGGWSADPVLAAGMVAAIGVLWWGLRARGDDARSLPGGRVVLVTMAMSVLAFFLLPAQVSPAAVKGEAGANAVANKTAYFVDASLDHLAGARLRSRAAPAARWLGNNPQQPFAHPERTPDTLGPLFSATSSGKAPNLVFIIVEGLGRSFSGPDTRYGSFTPFLDELGQRGLYWENFLAGQGRTFGVLPTLFGSLPYADNGFAALGARMPRNDSLLSVLKGQGYRLAFYTGSDPEFDEEGGFLRRAGVEQLVGQRDYGPEYKRSNEWGYADRDLMDMALRRESEAPSGPSVSVIQTTTMHNPFTFPGRDAYVKRVGQRLAQLGIARDKLPAYAAQPEIFASVLYADDALRMFFERAERLPGYANTIFIITGDHRLPELDMDTRLERFHVPLIVFSPLLKTPQSIKAVSSQFDVAPALLAFLSHQYGLQTPATVAWLGTGLDTEPAFRNLHVLPLKQTKTELSDFVSGTTYLAHGMAYKVGDGMRLDRLDDSAAQATAEGQFREFLGANATVAGAAELAPGTLAAYDGANRTLRSVAVASEASEVAVQGLRRSGGEGLLVEASFTNPAARQSAAFAPLLVITDERGAELGEATGPVRTLAAGETAKIALRFDMAKMPRGAYFMSMLPSDPQTGRSVGIGQYHVELRW